MNIQEMEAGREMDGEEWESEVITHMTNDAVSWIAGNWRFYISNDDDRPYWGFVHQNGQLEMETAFLSDEAIGKIVDLLAGKVG